MKKTLIALAVLGATAGVAHAQSNVTIYGVADTGYVKQTGAKATMDEKVNSRIGFRGVEDLGGGLKATFELEQRVQLHAGDDTNDRGSFEGAANVGLAGNWGAMRFGRVNELSTETLRTLDPFNQYGVGGMLETPLRGNDGEGRLSHTARYDSPNFSGFSGGASFTVKNNEGAPGAFASDGDADTDNYGYALSAKYMNGPIVVLGNYNRAVNSNDSYNWNLGGAYSFGPAKISLAYEKSILKTDPLLGDDVDVKNWLVGLSYKIGNGVINASYNRAKNDLIAGGDATAKKYALGYTHNLSKRTSVYADYSRTKLDDGSIYGDYTDAGDLVEDKINAIQVGITHKF